MKFQSSFLTQMTFLLVAVAVVPGFAQETDTSGSKTGAGVTAKPASSTVAKPATPATGTTKPVTGTVTPTAASSPAPRPKYTPAQLRALVNRQDPFPEKVNRRTPIPFKPFELKDAQGRPISRDTVIRLPNGKRMTAGEYTDTINALEERYTSLGYSLRERKPKSRKVVIEEPALDRAKLQTQKSRIQSAGLKLSTPPLNRTQALTAARATQVKLRQKANVSSLTDIPVRTQNQLSPGYSKNWEFEMGDEDYFYVNLNGRFELQGAVDKTTLLARGKADTEIFQRNFNLVDVDGRIVSRLESQPLTFSLDLSVFGKDLLSLDESQTSGYVKEGDKSGPVQWRREFPFQVGPVPMSVEFGVDGRAGVVYYVGLHPVTVNGMLIPYVHTEAWAQIALLELQVADAGVEGRITLLNDDLVLMGSAQTLVDEQQKPYVWLEYDSYNSMETLSGQIRLFACVWVPAGGWNVTDWEEDCTYKKLWDWEGFEQRDSLFHGTKKTYL